QWRRSGGGGRVATTSTTRPSTQWGIPRPDVNPYLTTFVQANPSSFIGARWLNALRKCPRIGAADEIRRIGAARLKS
ncbi:hypothetical protein Taro_031450, partial [Colocasia esculenta]|nr:hypothetical protein [Colocasia esculenta]